MSQSVCSQVVAVGIIALVFVARIAPSLSSQNRNLRAVDEYLVKIRPEWEQFKEENGYSELELNRFTGLNGTFAVSGGVPTNDDLQRVVSFIEATEPPRPLVTGALRVIPSNQLQATEQSKTTSAKEAKPPPFIRQIVAIEIPKIEAEDGTLPELLDFVAHRFRELDRRKPGGISILTSGFNKRVENEGGFADRPASEKKINYSAKRVRVDKVFMDLARLFEVEFHVTNIGVVVTPRGGQPFPNPTGDNGEVYFTYKTKTGRFK